MPNRSIRQQRMPLFKSIIFLGFCLSLQSAFSQCEVSTPVLRATYKNAREVDSDTLIWKLGHERGLQLKPGQAFELIVPPAFSQRIPDYAHIEHRKELFYFKPDDNGVDPNDAILRVDFFDPRTGAWKAWSDQFGPYKRSAAKPPTKPKKNTLYNLPENVGFFSPSRVRIVNVATGSEELAVSSIHTFGLTFLHNRESPADLTRTFHRFERNNRLQISFNLNREKGLALKQNEVFEFVFPEEFAGRQIFHVILKHRKDPVYAADPQNFDAIDPDAAYILCEARDRSTGFWHKWADRSSLKKFSEVRTADNPENETLHNCLRTFGNIATDRFRLTNAGTGAPEKCIAHIHGLEILFAPDVVNSSSIEEIFTPETAFSRPDLLKPVPLLGGGPRLAGRFPDAIILGPDFHKRVNAIAQLPEANRFNTQTRGKNCHVDENGDLMIDLSPGNQIESIELAIGDLDVTSLAWNKDGYFGRSGMAVADAEIERDGKSIVSLLSNNNIGMAGMVICGGPEEYFVSRPGDRIRVRIKNDNAFLMGYRLLLKPAR
ncbi:MAG: hypothetical protein AB1403_10860 [Candidatus Riflebacteria bacterium]